MGKDAYGTIARYYDTVFSRIDEPLRRRALEVHPVGDGDMVLDVGCGTGSQLVTYAEVGAICHGIDLSQAMLEVADGKLGDRAELTLGDAAAMPYGDDTFDLTLATLFLHELPQDTASSVVEEMSRVTRRGGSVMIIDYHVGSLRPQGVGWRTFSYATEFLAGWSHFTAFRRYLDLGVEGVRPSDLPVVNEKPIAGGNLAITVMEVA